MSDLIQPLSDEVKDMIIAEWPHGIWFVLDQERTGGEFAVDPALSRDLGWPD